MKIVNLYNIRHFRYRGRVVFAVTVAIIAAQVFFAIQSSSLGMKLASLEEERLAITKQNDDISKNLIESTSLIKIQEESQKLGFARPTNMVYINPEESVARLP